LNEFFVGGVFGSSVVVEGYVPLFEQICNSFMILIGELFRWDSKSHSLNLNWGSMLVRPADENDLVSLQSVVSSHSVG